MAKVHHFRTKTVKNSNFCSKSNGGLPYTTSRILKFQKPALLKSFFSKNALSLQKQSTEPKVTTFPPCVWLFFSHENPSYLFINTQKSFSRAIRSVFLKKDLEKTRIEKNPVLHTARTFLFLLVHPWELFFPSIMVARIVIVSSFKLLP